MFRNGRLFFTPFNSFAGFIFPAGAARAVLWLVDIYGAIGSSAGFFVTME